MTPKQLRDAANGPWSELRLVVVKSRSYDNLLSLRLQEDDATATSIRAALVAAGFKAGDRVRLTRVD